MDSKLLSWSFLTLSSVNVPVCKGKYRLGTGGADFNHNISDCLMGFNRPESMVSTTFWTSGLASARTNFKFQDVN